MLNLLKLDKVYEGVITNLENEGKGVLRLNGIVVFIPKALPGEKVRFRLIEKKKNYAVGKLINVVEKSDKRVEPKCPYYEECGGCNLRHQSDEENLAFKKEKVEIALKKIGKLDIKVNDVIPSSKNDYYRNKASFKVEDDKIGFYIEGTYQLVDIENCMLLDNCINDSLKIVRRYIQFNINNIKSVIIKKGNAKNEILIDIYSTDEKDIKIVDYLIKNINNLKTVIFNDKLCYGDGYITQIISGLMFNCSSKSFFQVNSYHVENLYNIAIKKANLKKKDVVLDLYSGTGTITCLLSKYVKNVIGIEIVEDAVNDAIKNAELNNISNVKFICGDVSKKITSIKESIDVIFVDPPRSGLERNLVSIIKNINPKKIVYISCNPVTLARDLSYFSDLYEAKEVTPVDMFPNTAHCESVCILERR